MQVFAMPGESLQQVGGECPEGWVEMKSQRHDDNCIAGNNGEWMHPIVPYKQYTGRDKFDIFTADEQRAIAGAAMSDVDIKLFYDRFTAALYVTYDDPEMVDGLKFMESNKLITTERHREIIAEMTSL